MAKNLKKQDENTGPASDIPVFLKIDSHFILKGSVQSVVRFGKGCKIMLTSGEELLAKVNYDKVVDLVG